MKRLFRGVYHKCRLYLNYWANLRVHNLFIQNQSGDSQTDEGKIAVFDVEDNRFTRHLYNFIKFFTISGYKVYLKKRVSFVGNLRDYSEILLETNNLYLVDQLPDEVNLKFSTSEDQGFIQLDDNYFSLKKSNEESLSYPFSMHPEIYENNYLDQIKELRDADKRARIFFAGAINPEYKHKNFSTLFNVIDRYSLFQNICRHYSNQELLTIETKRDFDLFSHNGYLNKIVIIKSGQKHLTPRGKWFPLLAGADFFLAFPGVKILACHNLIEAMSLGVIPIVQRTDYLAFPLENNVNCVAFQTCEELFCKMDEILKMDSSDVKKLREGVVDYYESHLNPEKVIEKIERKAQNGSLKKFYIYSELNSVNKLSGELHQEATN